MGLLGGLIVGGIGRTIGGVVNRLQDPRSRPPVNTRDTIIAGRVGPLGGALTKERRIGPGQVPMPAPSQLPARSSDRNAWEMDQFGNWRLKRGYMVNKRGKVQKRPTMQVANPRAAVRALRRVRGFEKIARQIIKVTPKFKSKPTYRGGSRRKSCK